MRKCILMSQNKKAIRANFRDAVFGRDNHRCKVCGKESSFLDAHHITNRKQMPNGGYVLENGISLCAKCHVKAEEEYFAVIELHPNYASEKLYELIASSHSEAIKASEKLKDE